MKKITKIDGVQKNTAINSKLELPPTVVFQQVVTLSWKVLRLRKVTMNNISILVRIGSSPVSTLMKV